MRIGVRFALPRFSIDEARAERSHRGQARVGVAVGTRREAGVRDARGLSWALLVGGMALVGGPGAAWGQRAPAARAAAKAPISDADKAAAGKAYDLGLVAVGRDRWDEACARYREAWTLMRHWQIALNLAEAEQRLGKYKDAIEHLSFFLQSPEANARKGKDAEAERKQATAWLAEARAKLGTLRFVDLPAGTVVEIDGENVGTAPLAEGVQLDPRSHEVEARLGDKTARQTVEVVSGKIVNVTLRLQGPVKAPVGVGPGPVGPTVPRESGQGSARPFPTQMVVVVGGAGLAGVGIAASIGLLVASSDKVAAAEKVAKGLPGKTGDGSDIRCAGADRAVCDANRDLLRQSDELGNAGRVTLGVGVALAVGTAIFAFLGPRPKTTGVHLMPAVGAREGGLVVVGEW